MPTGPSLVVDAPLPAAPVRSRDTLLDIVEVCRRTSLRPTTIRKLTRQHRFPERIFIGAAARWSADEVQDWIDARKAERDARQP